MNFKVIPTHTIPQEMLHKASAWCGKVDDSTCFLVHEGTNNYYFFGKKLKYVWLWLNDCWVVTDTYLTLRWREYFTNLLNESVNKMQTPYKETVTPITTSKSVSVLDMIAQFTDEEFSRLPLDVRLQIVTSLVRDDIKSDNIKNKS